MKAPRDQARTDFSRGKDPGGPVGAGGWVRFRGNEQRLSAGAPNPLADHLTDRDVHISAVTTTGPSTTCSTSRVPNGSAPSWSPPTIGTAPPPPRPPGLGTQRRAYWIVVPDADEPALTAFELTDGRYELVAKATGDEVFPARRPFAVDVQPSALPTRLRRAGPPEP